jgi:hypothetical protein
MSGTCSRCGRTGEMEYGTDGLPYCSACIFYGQNKQCYRCRMYLPATELQQYRGQWACPYCIQDMRDEDRRITERAVTHDRPRLDAYQIPEQCERCGRDLEGRVYIWNGRKLCKKCLDDEQNTWGLVSGKPGGPVQRIKVDVVEQGKRRSALELAIGEFLALFGMKKRPVSEIIVYHPRMKGEISAAKPMAEGGIAAKGGGGREGEGKREKKGPIVAVEGPMDAGRKKIFASDSGKRIAPLEEKAEIVALKPAEGKAPPKRPGKKKQ